MAGTMSQADLIEDLKGILNDSAAKFTAAGDADFVRHLDVAARDMSRVRRRTLIGSATLVAEQHNYPAPADIVFPKFPTWGTNQRRRRKPWQTNYPERLPTLSLVEGDSGMELYLNPAPTAAQIADFGTDYTYFYFAAHSIGTDAADTTVRLVDRDLLLIRATAQAMTELAHHNVAKPVQLSGRGVGSMPKNGAPQALANDLMDLFERMAA